MQRKDHPNHHRIVLVIPAALFMGLIMIAVVLGLTLADRTLLFIIIGAITVADTAAGILIISQVLKRCQCPGCKQSLTRNPDPEARGIEFPCEACDTVWVSRVGSGG